VRALSLREERTCRAVVEPHSRRDEVVSMNAAAILDEIVSSVTAWWLRDQHH
jgi:hypothetical protein